MAYVVALVSAWLALVALTALRPRRRGVLAAISYPVGWVAGELPAQAITVELALLGLLAWWGWPVGWIDPVVAVLALVVVTGNLALFTVSLLARRGDGRRPGPPPRRREPARGRLRALVANGGEAPRAPARAHRDHERPLRTRTVPPSRRLAHERRSPGRAA